MPPRRWIPVMCRELPVTSATLLAAAVLLVSVYAASRWTGTSLYVTRGWLGMVLQESWPGQPSLYGPFSLWAGQWWRILASAFHHGGWLAGAIHLFLNGTSLWFLGLLIEPKLSRFIYLFVFLAACFVSLLPEYGMGHYAIGLSGAIYALFGAGMVLRRYDPETAELLSLPVIYFGLGFLVICEVVHRLGWLNIANAAHLAGLVYGWFAGFALLSPAAKSRSVRLLFFTAHLLLIPATQHVIAPRDSARFHWYRAKTAATADERLHHFEIARKLAPRLGVHFTRDQLAAAVAARGAEYAERLVETGQLVGPARQNLWPELVIVLAESAKPSQAYDVIRHASAIDQKNQALWLTLAAYFITRGEPVRAVQALEAAESSVPRQGGFFWQLCGILHNHGDDAAAWRIGLEGVRRYPRTSLGRWLIGQLWLEMTAKERETALSTLREVFGDESGLWLRRLGLDPKSPTDIPLTPFQSNSGTSP